MTLRPANLQENGVRSRGSFGAACRHEAELNVDTYDEATTVPSFGPKMVCTCCGIIGADVRPNWSERAADRELDRPAVAALISRADAPSAGRASV